MNNLYRHFLRNARLLLYVRHGGLSAVMKLVKLFAESVNIMSSKSDLEVSKQLNVCLVGRVHLLFTLRTSCMVGRRLAKLSPYFNLLG